MTKKNKTIILIVVGGAIAVLAWLVFKKSKPPVFRALGGPSKIARPVTLSSE